MKYSIILPYYDPKYQKTQIFTALLRSIVENSKGEDYEFVIVKDGPSYVESHNRGLAAAKGEYLVVLNDDTLICEEGWLEKLRQDEGISSSKVKDVPQAYCFLMSRKVFNKLGPMDERFKYGINWEDTDYFRRAKLLGVPFYERPIAVKHYGGTTTEVYLGGVNEKEKAINKKLYLEKWGTEKF